MTPGPMRRPMGFSDSSRGPIEMKLRKNQHVKPEDLFFFFGDHLISTRKTVRISGKTFFFFEIIFRTKLKHFLRLFWTSQNRISVIFELAPGPLTRQCNHLHKGIGLNQKLNFLYVRNKIFIRPLPH